MPRAGGGLVAGTLRRAEQGGNPPCSMGRLASSLPHEEAERFRSLRINPLTGAVVDERLAEDPHKTGWRRERWSFHGRTPYCAGVT